MPSPTDPIQQGPQATPPSHNESEAALETSSKSVSQATLSMPEPIQITRIEAQFDAQLLSAGSKDVVKALQTAGHEAYLVGGCIRDALLGYKPKDFDVATSAQPDSVRPLFRKCRLIGRRFRLAHVFSRGELVEVATFRKDASSSKAQESDAQKVAESGILTADNAYGNLEEDIIRRDFTINALYYDPSSNIVMDGAGGLEDLKAKKIRIIGDPETRFTEDPVRILRALRFAAKLDFEIEAKTEAAIPKLAHLLSEIPSARLFEELQKLFICAYGQKCLEQLLKYDILQYLLPQTQHFLHYNTAREMIQRALENTEKRILQGKTVTPSFLLAIFLWAPVRAWQSHFISKKVPPMLALHQAVQQVVQTQVKATALPKRFTGPMQDIFELQERLCRASRKSALKTLSHRRFRAAFDFLVIRELAGDIEPGIAKWWLNLQTASPEERSTLLSNLRAHSNRRKNS